MTKKSEFSLFFFIIFAFTYGREKPISSKKSHACFITNSRWRLGENNKQKMNIPQNLSHKPIVAVDYKNEDCSGDAFFLSIGEATWNDPDSDDQNLDYSAKVLRQVETTKHWSRQSEELPFWRVIDLETLLIAVINDKKSEMNEEIVNQGKLKGLRQFIERNNELYQSKINKLKEVITNK